MPGAPSTNAKPSATTNKKALMSPSSRLPRQLTWMSDTMPMTMTGTMTCWMMDSCSPVEWNTKSINPVVIIVTAHTQKRRERDRETERVPSTGAASSSR
jgi:hypothetical protein